jgi:methionyl-tRNA formyltransferase
LNKQSLKFWRARALPQSLAEEYCTTQHNSPGVIMGASKDGFVVCCGSGALEVLEIQKPGGKRVLATQWLQAEKSEH